MRRYLAGLAVIAALVLAGQGAGWATGTDAPEAPTPAMAALQRRVTWDAQRIRNLQQRRAYLHRYIQKLRAPTPVAAPATSTSTSSVASGPLYISEAEAASAMRAAGFSEDVIAWFNSGIIDRESGYCPTAVYPGHCGDVSLFVAGGPACSLFQLFRCPGPQAADPYVAARYAYAKFQHQGYGAWGG